MSQYNLYKMLAPTSVAVIGDIVEQTAFGRVALKNMFGSGYKGKVYLVESGGLHPSVEEDLLALEGKVDLALVTAPLEKAPGIIEACGRAGVPGALLIRRETDNPELLARITAQARESKVRLIGPASAGLMLSTSQLNASFAEELPPKGNLALICQSRAMYAAVLDVAISNGVGLSHLIHPGMMVDIDLADLIDHLCNHSLVRAILLQVEEIPNLRKFISAARAATRNKPIVILRSGRDQENENPAGPPTGLITRDRVYEAAFKRAGAVRVETVDELFDCAVLLSKQPQPRGPNLAVISNDQAPAKMAADSLAKLDLCPTTEERCTVREIDPAPGQGLGRNPVVVKAGTGGQAYEQALEDVLAEGWADGAMLIAAPPYTRDPGKTAAHMAGFLAKRKIPIFTVWLGADYANAARKTLEEAGIPAYRFPERAVTAFNYLYTYGRNLELIQEIPRLDPRRSDIDQVWGQGVIEEALDNGDRQLSRTAMVELLSAYGLHDKEKGAARNGLQLSLVMGFRRVEDLGTAFIVGQAGAGPILARDWAIGLPPVNRLLARRVLEETRIYRYYSEIADKNEVLLNRLEELVTNLAQLALDLPEVTRLDIRRLNLYPDRIEALSAEADLKATDGLVKSHLLISPYPNQYQGWVEAKDGRRFFIRPIRPEDAEHIRELYSTFSSRTIYLRYLNPGQKLTDQLLIRFSQVDYDREMALVAAESDRPQAKVVGVVRLIGEPNSERAEYSIVVGDPWHGTGIGVQLMKRILEIGLDRGIGQVWGLVANENRPMINLGRKLGGRVRREPMSDELEMLFDLNVEGE